VAGQLARGEGKPGRFGSKQMSAVLCRTTSARPVCALEGAAAPKVAFETALNRTMTQE
jgi:hypothetical protein